MAREIYPNQSVCQTQASSCTQSLPSLPGTMFRKQAFSTTFKRLNHRMVYEANPQKAQAFKSFEQHTEEHAASTTSLWRNISLGCIPVLALCAYYVYGTESHHLHHREQIMQVPDADWPVEMEYQNLRYRKFYWGDGDKTLFWSWANHKGSKE